MRIAKWSLVVTMLGGIAVGASFGADPPSLINYQGVLRDSADRPVTSDVDMVFRFYDAPAGGNEILVDEHIAGGVGPVSVASGLFSVQLGSGTVSDGQGPGTFASLVDVFPVFDGVYLEVEVGGEILVPRTRLLASPYALNPTKSVAVIESTILNDYTLTTTFANTGHEVTVTTEADERVHLTFLGRFSTTSANSDLQLAYTVDNGPEVPLASDFEAGGSEILSFSLFTAPLASGPHTVRLRARKTSGGGVIKGTSGGATDSRLQAILYGR